MWFFYNSCMLFRMNTKSMFDYDSVNCMHFLYVNSFREWCSLCLFTIAYVTIGIKNTPTRPPSLLFQSASSFKPIEISLPNSHNKSCYSEKTHGNISSITFWTKFGSRLHGPLWRNVKKTCSLFASCNLIADTQSARQCWHRDSRGRNGKIPGVPFQSTHVLLSVVVWFDNRAVLTIVQLRN